MNGINRAFNGLPISIFEKSLIVFKEDIEDNIYPWFDEEKLYSALTYYFDSSLGQYTSKYNLEYYMIENDSSYCLSSICSGVHIDVSASVVFNLNISRSFEYFVKDNRHG